jgi:hypothetical protein
MEILEKIRTFIQELDEKEFRTYLIATLSAIFIVLIFFVAFYLKRISTLKKQITYVNEKREEVKTILDKTEVVDQEQQKIDTLLGEKTDFKIQGYFDDTLKKLNLTYQSIAGSKGDKDATYREVVLKASFDDLTMKKLCDLLEELEKNRLVYTKELEITKSKKTKAIDVALTIATLQKKSQTTEVAE